MDRAIPLVLAKIAEAAVEQLGDYFLRRALVGEFKDYPRESMVSKLLSEWSIQDPRPIVVVLDEVDALIGDTLLLLLRELRSGYPTRPHHFPQSVILCGVRDIRDYRIFSSREKEGIAGGSAFSIRAKSLRLGDFTRDEVATLYAQHTAETGQVFEPGVLERVWHLTRGQPWLVNALAHEVTWEMREGRDRGKPIGAEAIERAKEALILGQVTHIDQLAHKLREDRVRHVVEPILEGEDPVLDLDEDDVRYCIDLGLVTRVGNGLEIANPIYREVIPRSLTNPIQLALETTYRTAWYVGDDGTLDMAKLLAAFQQFFRENSEQWGERFHYREAGPQLLLQGFLQRIVNGGGRVEREYGLGRKRTDLLVIWPYPGGTQRTVIEIKATANPPGESALSHALEQTADYMDRSGGRDGHLVWFDQGNRAWQAKIYHRVCQHGAHAIQLWGA